MTGPDPRALPEIATAVVRTARAATCVHRIAGRDQAVPVVLLHGTMASSVFFFPLMRQLPRRFRPVAIDLRGFGGSQALPVDAARGVRDYSDDVLAALDELGLDQVHLVGWSLGGAVAAQATIDAPQRISSITLLAPISPLGFGGLWNEAGVLVDPDGVGLGAGAGMVAAEVVAALTGGDPAGPSGAPIKAMVEHLYTGPGWDRQGERALVDAIFTTAVGAANFPGESVSIAPWPGFAVGRRGLLNAISPRNLNVTRLVDVDPKPPILWVRGDADKMIADRSSMDVAHRARKGAFGGLPAGADLAPQPMLAQTRAVLDGYVTCGGTYREEVLSGIGHSPHIEDVPRLLEALVPHLDGAARP